MSGYFEPGQLFKQTGLHNVCSALKADVLDYTVVPVPAF